MSRRLLCLLAGLAPAPEAAAQQPWELSATVLAYFPPDVTFAVPVVTADRARLHLEARYNYEALEAGSVWAGANFSGGKDVTWELSPFAGAVFGSTFGFAPGYRGWVRWWRLELMSEGEYVIDLEDDSSSFFYNWSELSFVVREGVSLGLVTQRTRTYQTERDLQRGLLAGFAAGKFSATVYLFNPDDPDPTFVLGATVEF